MKRILALAMVIYAVAITVSWGIDPTANFRFHRKYDQAQGVIWFDHKAHVIRQGRNCEQCHTDRLDPNGGYIGTNVRGQDGVFRNTGHAVCMACHDFENTNNGANAPQTGCTGGLTGTPAGSCHDTLEP
jgi:cytochrome c553